MKPILTCATLLMVTGIVAGQTLKISPNLENEDPEKDVSVIVQYRDSQALAARAKSFQADGSWRATFPSVHAVLLRIKAADLPGMQHDPDVLYVTEDRPLHALLNNTAPAVKAPYAWNRGLTGSGIGIAFIDSGISPHNDLDRRSNRIVHKQSFVAGDADDMYGHGEHVAGIAAGDGFDSSCWFCFAKFEGIAPKSDLIDLRVLDGTGSGSDSTVIAAIEAAIDLKNRYNIRVMNISLGRPAYESYRLDPLCAAVEAAWKAGIVVVVAAGNEGRDGTFGNQGYGTITSPGNDPYVITVGAMKSMGTPGREDDLIASYSSKGPTPVDHIIKPDLVAPGNLVSSLMSPNGSLHTQYPQNIVPFSAFVWWGWDYPSNEYFILSGTSMAAPVVSGAAAILLQQHPQLTPDQVKAKLMRTTYRDFPSSSTAYDPTTGQSYTSYYDLFTVGAGYLDIEAAIRDSTPFHGTALSPAATILSGAGTDGAKGAILCTEVSICASSNWSSGTVYGDKSVWGTKSVWATNAIWASKSVWATSSIDEVESINVAIKGEK